MKYFPNIPISPVKAAWLISCQLTHHDQTLHHRRLQSGIHDRNLPVLCLFSMYFHFIGNRRGAPIPRRKIRRPIGPLPRNKRAFSAPGGALLVSPQAPSSAERSLSVFQIRQPPSRFPRDGGFFVRKSFSRPLDIYYTFVVYNSCTTSM